MTALLPAAEDCEVKLQASSARSGLLSAWQAAVRCVVSIGLDMVSCPSRCLLIGNVSCLHWALKAWHADEEDQPMTSSPDTSVVPHLVDH